MNPAPWWDTAPACLPVSTPWRGAVFASAFALAPVLAYLWPLGFSVVVPLTSGLLVPLWLRPQRPWPAIALLAGLALWGAGTLAWSLALPALDPSNPETQAGIKLLVQLPAFGVFAAAAVGLSGESARRALVILAVGLVLLGVVLALEGATAAAVYQALQAALGDPIRPDLAERNVGKGQFVLALLAWPVLVFLHGEQRPLVPLLVGLLLLCPLLLNEQAPLVALAAGGVAFLAVRGAGRWGARAVGALLAVQLLASPWVVRAAADAGLFEAAKRAAPASWAARLDVWDVTSANILLRPWLGWGLDASRMVPGMPLHPHNAALQVWLELGAVGAALLALVWLRVFESVARVAVRDRTAAAACAGGAGAYFTVGALSYGVWQEWWLGLAALLAAVCTALVVHRDRERMASPPDSLYVDGLKPL